MRNQKNHIREGILVLIVYTMISCSWLHAQPESGTSDIAEADRFLDMSLEELMNVKVTVASKSIESIMKTSGTVYVLDQKDFKRFGWRTVGEALQGLPGIDLSMNYRYLDGGHRGFGSDFSETILLLDGREVQKLRNGRASQPLMIIPLHNVERIEVLQGPASTLYGSHALQGVISIKTKTANSNRDDEMISASLLYGDASTQEIAINAHKKAGDFYIGLSAHKFYSDRDWDELAKFYTNPDNLRQGDNDTTYDYILNTDPNDFNNYQRDNSISLFMKYKGLYAGANYFEGENLHTPGVDDFSGSIQGGIQESLLFFGYRHEFSENLKAFVEIERLFQRDIFREIFLNKDSLSNLGDIDTISFENIDRNERYYFAESQRWDSDVWKLKGKVDARIFEFNFLSVGFDVWDGHYFSGNGPNTFYTLNSDELEWENTKSRKYSVFVQDKLQFFDNRLNILVGIRYNKEDFVEDSYTPRISIVGEPIPGSVIKASYSEDLEPFHLASLDRQSEVWIQLK